MYIIKWQLLESTPSKKNRFIIFTPIKISFRLEKWVATCIAAFAKTTEFLGFYNINANEIVSKALKTPQNIGIAYTYNEPFTFYEFMFETAQ